MSQTEVRTYQASGIVGELYDNGHGTPVRARSFIAASTASASNVFGNAVQMVTDSADEVTGDLTTAGVFAGIASFPKNHVSSTVSTEFDYDNGAPVEVIQQGAVWVDLEASTTAGNVGTAVEYSLTDGTLRACDGTASDGYAVIANAQIDVYNVTTAGGQTVIRFDALNGIVEYVAA